MYMYFIFSCIVFYVFSHVCLYCKAHLNSVMLDNCTVTVTVTVGDYEERPSLSCLREKDKT